MIDKPTEIALAAPGQGRCRCGALLCRVIAPSCVDVKCRRCARIVRVRLDASKRPAFETMQKIETVT